MVGCGSQTDLKLIDAANKGGFEAVEGLLADGANVNYSEWDGDTPLHNSAREGHLEVVELLLKKGADVNSKLLFGDTPLDGTESKEVQELLIDNGGKTGDELYEESK